MKKAKAAWVFFLFQMLASVALAECVVPAGDFLVSYMRGQEVNILKRTPVLYYDTDLFPTQFEYQVEATSGTACQVYALKPYKGCLQISIFVEEMPFNGRCTVSVKQSQKFIGWVTYYKDEPEIKLQKK